MASTHKANGKEIVSDMKKANDALKAAKACGNSAFKMATVTGVVMIAAILFSNTVLAIIFGIVTGIITLFWFLCMLSGAAALKKQDAYKKAFNGVASGLGDLVEYL